MSSRQVAVAIFGTLHMESNVLAYAFVKYACVCTKNKLWSAGFSQDEELRPDFEDLSPEAAWQSVLETIEQHENGQHKHRLHLAAVQAALAKERRLKLPPPLLAPFQACFQPLTNQHAHELSQALVWCQCNVSTMSNRCSSKYADTDVPCLYLRHCNCFHYTSKVSLIPSKNRLLSSRVL